MTTQDNISYKTDNQTRKKRGRKRNKVIYTVVNIHPEMTDEERKEAQREVVINLMKTMEMLNREQKQNNQR